MPPYCMGYGVVCKLPAVRKADRPGYQAESYHVLLKTKYFTQSRLVTIHNDHFYVHLMQECSVLLQRLVNRAVKVRIET